MKRALLLCILLAQALPGGSAFESQAQAAPSASPGQPRARTTFELMSPVQEQHLVESRSMQALAAAQPVSIYLNRNGGTFTPGDNDARTNHSTLTPQATDFPAADFSDADWNAVLQCVKGQFDRFNVEVSDQDPGDLPHYEAVVSTSSLILGQEVDVGGVSPFTSQCDVIPNSVVFIFTDAIAPEPQAVCEVIAQEVAHSFGLDHEFLCEDPMSYLTGCGKKAFQDRAAPCGEYEARPCSQVASYDCGYAEQNSVALLKERIGLKGEGPSMNEVGSPEQIVGSCAAAGSTDRSSSSSLACWLLAALALIVRPKRARC